MVTHNSVKFKRAKEQVARILNAILAPCTTHCIDLIMTNNSKLNILKKCATATLAAPLKRSHVCRREVNREVLARIVSADPTSQGTDPHLGKARKYAIVRD